jgi:hypothetical protein
VIRFVAGSTLTLNVGALPLVTVWLSRLPKPSYPKLCPHPPLPVVAAETNLFKESYWYSISSPESQSLRWVMRPLFWVAEKRYSWVIVR